MKIVLQICILVFSLPLTSAALAAAVATETTEAGNMYVSGADVKVVTPVAADLFAAGRHVSIEREVGADATIAGGSVDVRAPVEQDLRAAGGTVNIEGNIGGELIAAGRTIRLESSSAVAGPARLAGSDIALSGKVGKSVKAYANKITVSGEINGNTLLYGQEITLLPGAKINGNLSYASPNPLIQDKSAQITGIITREQMPEGENRKDAGARTLPRFPLFFILGMLAAGMVLYLLFPNAVAGIQHAIRQHPVRSLLTGLALLFAVPLAAILFMVTVIGIPVGFALLGFYPLMLMLGYLGAAFFIGGHAAAVMRHPPNLTLGRQALFLALALIALSVVALIPFLGGLILILASVTGIGGWAVWLYMRYRPAEPTTG